MILIKEIGTYLPQDSIDSTALGERFGADPGFIDGKLGIRQVTRKSPGEDTSDLCVGAFRALSGKSGLSARDLDCLVVCTQNPDGNGLPHTSAIVQAKLDAPESCATFDISLGCSGYVYGLSIVTAFMQANGLKRGVLMTADPYSKIIDPDDRNTAMLFGDGATATLLLAEDRGPGWCAGPFIFSTYGRQGEALHNRDGRLHMNGRAVFNFCATAVPNAVRTLLGQTGLDPAQIDLFIFHQGSRYIVDAVRARLQLEEAKVPLKLAHCGNTVSSSIPIVLEEYCGRGGEGLKRILLSGFGVGLSVASCLLERQS